MKREMGLMGSSLEKAIQRPPTICEVPRRVSSCPSPLINPRAGTHPGTP